jgi:hypothetical protein
MHRPKLSDEEYSAIEAASLLLEKDRTGRIQSDRDRSYREEWCKDRQGKSRTDNINHSLACALDCGEGAGLDLYASGTSQAPRRMSEQFGCSTHRDEHDREWQHPQVGGKGTKVGPTFRIGLQNDFIDFGTTNMFDNAGAEPFSGTRVRAHRRQTKAAVNAIAEDRESLRQASMSRGRLISDQDEIRPSEPPATEAFS